MAKFFRRFKTDMRKYRFTLAVHSLQLSLAEPEALSITWTRGLRHAETEATVGVGGLYSFSEDVPMVLDCTLYQTKSDKSSGSFQKKESHVVVRQQTPRGYKEVGQCLINLADYASNNDAAFDFTLPLTKCTDPNARLKVTICSSWLQNNDGHVESESNWSENSDGYPELSPPCSETSSKFDPHDTISSLNSSVNLEDSFYTSPSKPTLSTSSSNVKAGAEGVAFDSGSIYPYNAGTAALSSYPLDRSHLSEPRTPNSLYTSKSALGLSSESPDSPRSPQQIVAEYIARLGSPSGQTPSSSAAYSYAYKEASSAASLPSSSLNKPFPASLQTDRMTVSMQAHPSSTVPPETNLVPSSMVSTAFPRRLSFTNPTPPVSGSSWETGGGGSSSPRRIPYTGTTTTNNNSNHNNNNSNNTGGGAEASTQAAVALKAVSGGMVNGLVESLMAEVTAVRQQLMAVTDERDELLDSIEQQSVSSSQYDLVTLELSPSPTGSTSGKKKTRKASPKPSAAGKGSSGAAANPSTGGSKSVAKLHKEIKSLQTVLQEGERQREEWQRKFQEADKYKREHERRIIVYRQKLRKLDPKLGNGSVDKEKEKGWNSSPVTAEGDHPNVASRSISLTIPSVQSEDGAHGEGHPAGDMITLSVHEYEELMQEKQTLEADLHELRQKQKKAAGSAVKSPASNNGKAAWNNNSKTASTPQPGPAVPSSASGKKETKSIKRNLTSEFSVMDGGPGVEKQPSDMEGREGLVEELTLQNSALTEQLEQFRQQHEESRAAKAGASESDEHKQQVDSLQQEIEELKRRMAEKVEKAQVVDVLPPMVEQVVVPAHDEELIAQVQQLQESVQSLQAGKEAQAGELADIQKEHRRLTMMLKIERSALEKVTMEREHLRLACHQLKNDSANKDTGDDVSRETVGALAAGEVAGDATKLAMEREREVTDRIEQGMEAERKRIENTVRETKLKLLERESACDVMQREVRLSQAAQQRLERELGNLKEQLRDSLAQVVSLKVKLGESQLEVETLKTNLTTVRNERRNFKNSLAKVNVTVQLVEADLLAKRNEVERWKDAVNAAKFEAAQALTELQAELAAEKSKMRAAEVAVLAAQNEAATLKMDLEAGHHQNKGLEEGSVQQREHIRQLDQSLALMKTQSSELSREMAALSEEKQTLASQLEESLNSKTAADEEILRLQTSIAESQAGLNLALQHHADDEAKMKALQEHLFAAENTSSEMVVQLLEKQALFEETTSMLKSQSKQCKQLEELLAAKEQEHEELFEKHENLERQYEGLADTHQEMELKFRELYRIKELLDQHCADLGREKRMVDMEMDERNLECGELRARVQDAIARRNEAEMQLSNLRQGVDSDLFLDGGGGGGGGGSGGTASPLDQLRAFVLAACQADARSAALAAEWHANAGGLKTSPGTPGSAGAQVKLNHFQGLLSLLSQHLQTKEGLLAETAKKCTSLSRQLQLLDHEQEMTTKQLVMTRMQIQAAGELPPPIRELNLNDIPDDHLPHELDDVGSNDGSSNTAEQHHYEEALTKLQVDLAAKSVRYGNAVETIQGLEEQIGALKDMVERERQERLALEERNQSDKVDKKRRKQEKKERKHGGAGGGRGHQRTGSNDSTYSTDSTVSNSSTIMDDAGASLAAVTVGAANASTAASALAQPAHAAADVSISQSFLSKLDSLKDSMMSTSSSSPAVGSAAAKMTVSVEKQRQATTTTSSPSPTNTLFFANMDAVNRAGTPKPSPPSSVYGGPSPPSSVYGGGSTEPSASFSFLNSNAGASTSGSPDAVVAASPAALANLLAAAVQTSRSTTLASSSMATTPLVNPPLVAKHEPTQSAAGSNAAVSTPAASSAVVVGSATASGGGTKIPPPMEDDDEDVLFADSAIAATVKNAWQKHSDILDAMGDDM